MRYVHVHGLFTLILIICMSRFGSSRMISSNSQTLKQASSNNFDVIEYGAVGDGSHDDSHAFLAAWKSACEAGPHAVTITIPAKKTYLLRPIKFKGPCSASSINVNVMGTLIALDINSWPKNSRHWIFFSNVKGLVVDGNGVLDGRGADWWTKEIRYRPTALTFQGCENLQLRNLTHTDSARNHISISGCNGVTISNLQINAPEDSPNTDGINVGESTFVNIDSCTIATGDDCISILGQTNNVHITNIGCGPGHGISIGSLGGHGSTDKVEEIHVSHITFNKTMNGARIKTWQGGKGYAKGISFRDITLMETNHPIIIDQFYCNSKASGTCQNKTEAVRISDVTFDGFFGTSTGKDDVLLHCSETYGCTDIVINNITLVPVSSLKGKLYSCVDAHGRETGTIFPAMRCLLP